VPALLVPKSFKTKVARTVAEFRSSESVYTQNVAAGSVPIVEEVGAGRCTVNGLGKEGVQVL
jgi:hypothetical protein